MLAVFFRVGVNIPTHLCVCHWFLVLWIFWMFENLYISCMCVAVVQVLLWKFFGFCWHTFMVLGFWGCFGGTCIWEIGYSAFAWYICSVNSWKNIASQSKTREQSWRWWSLYLVLRSQKKQGNVVWDDDKTMFAAVTVVVLWGHQNLMAPIRNQVLIIEERRMVVKLFMIVFSWMSFQVKSRVDQRM